MAVIISSFYILSKLNVELSTNALDSSNLKMAIEKGRIIAENISVLCGSADFDGKQQLQNLVFPEGIMYNKKTHTVRTQRINTLFAEIPLRVSILDENKKGNPNKNYLFLILCPELA